MRREILFRQQAPSVSAHQQWTVAPIPDEIAVVPSTLDQQIGEPKRKRAVAAWPWPQPNVGFVCQPGLTRLHDDQPETTFEGLDDHCRMGQPRDTWVVAPENETAAVRDIRHNATDA